MQYGLVQWFLSLDYFVLGCAAVHSKSKSHRIVVIHSIFITVVVVVTHADVVLKHTKADYGFIAEGAFPMGVEVFIEYLK